MSIATLPLTMRVQTYVRHNLSPDLVAGLTGATVGIPQAMAFALLAGVSPVYGLYAAVIAPIVGALAGSATYMTTGPTNALALVTGSALLAVGSSHEVGRQLATLAFLVGAFQLALGLLRLGDLTRFVSRTVMTGFLTGAALLVALGQVSNLTGIPDEHHSLVFYRVVALIENVDQLHLPTLATGLLTIAVILLFRRTSIRALGIFIAVMFASAVVAALGSWASDVTLVRNIAHVPSGLPGIVLPEPEIVSSLAVPALAIALLGLVQTAALSQNLKEPDGRLPNASREFIGQGLGNMATGLFQGLPSGGSLSRTAVNVLAGARTRLANVWAGLIVALIIILFSGWVERIALAALAGQLILAATSLIDVAEIRFLWNASWGGRGAMTVTFASTLVLPLEYSVYVGVALSLLMYIFQSSRIHISQLEPVGPYQFREVPFSATLPDRTPVILSVQGHLFFAAMRDLERRLPNPNHARQPVLILRLRGDDLLAGTGTSTLITYADRLRERGGQLILCGVEEPVFKTLRRTGALHKLGAENVFVARDVLLMSLQEAVEHAQQWLAAQPVLPPDETPVVRAGSRGWIRLPARKRPQKPPTSQPTPKN
jgi:sulfate permease, SulP family